MNLKILLVQLVVLKYSLRNLGLQSTTWSEYKQHNTITFLVCVATILSINYISECHTEKNITLTKESVFWMNYQLTMAGKGLNLLGECSPINVP